MDGIDNSRMLTTEELAGVLSVPVSTIYRWRYRGEGPKAFRIGKHLRFWWTDVETWLAERADPSPR